jgi:hypothetical protein
MSTEQQPSDRRINDRAFTARLKQVLGLRDFIVRELSPDQKRASADVLTLEGLYPLTYARTGREPSADEWSTLEQRFFDLNLLLDPDSRKKFALREFPTLVIHVAIYSLAASLAALFIAVYPDLIPTSTVFTQSTVVLPSFVAWNVCLGILGSIAFISVNALSMQADVTFDITNVRFVLLRIVLGALFGVLISLPVGYNGFYSFCKDLAASGKAIEATQIYSSQVVYLLLPFLAGFSASLFMTIISKFITGVQSLFGIDGSKTATQVQPQPKSIMG